MKPELIGVDEMEGVCGTESNLGKRVFGDKGRHILGEENGMVTVEVSVIIPVLTFIITGAVFFVLFLLDMAVVKSETQRIADETAVAWKTEGKLSTGDYNFNSLLQRPAGKLIGRDNSQLRSKARKRLRKRILTRTCLVREVEPEVRAGSFSIRASCRLYFHIPLRTISDLFQKESWFYHCSSRALIDQVQEELRASYVLSRRKEKDGE